ncbi:AraC family transcriptional regulator [Leucobacter tenebrionis]|uniref:AraC family transcriptional regulator n=1 Tax=Leucobacter tenebrionis TaxID=2873270 RepID=UPI001CA6C0A1|nr:AraC family transcriptional regulator [Leucobacter tenebrionis]QZY51672.1 AraC family transcriptional regulator [Leucobacter tenebrionis]
MSSSQSPLRAVGVSAQARSLHAAQALGERLYYRHRLTPLIAGTASDELTLTLTAARLGPVTAGLLRYSTAVRIDTDPYETAFQVNVPLQGTLRTSIGDQHLQATSSRAALYTPDVSTAISGWEQPCVMLAIKLDRELVEQRLAHELAASGERPWDAAELDVSRGVGRAWITAVRSTIRTTQRLADLDAGIVRYFGERCVDGFIVSVLRSEGEETDGKRSDDRVVASAMEAIMHAEGPPLSLGVIAEYAGVSGRTLQSAFRQVIGESPMRAQRRERLRRVRKELLASDPLGEQVGAVALRHGFTHLGRFSGQYREEFGELPSVTLDR